MDKLLKINNKLINSGNKIVCHTPVDPYNPLGLPPNTVRVRTNDGNVPKKTSWAGKYDTATLVPGTTDVYDVFKSGTNFERLLRGSDNVIEVLGANTSGITNMEAMFFACTLLPNVPLFDTSSVTNMDNMFTNCTSLTNVPLFDTSSVTDMMYTFHNCINVQSGALALYQQVSTQVKPPSFHTGTFMECGSNTQTGAEELAQIPSNWK